ncbi:MAG: serine/threonine protein kinase, partial [Myxococcales bacterium]|nr:serine/threonine protein kinase [Myxococcales bacterium]
MDLDLASRRIDHRYELVRVIGAGGMATVLEAVDTNLDKRVAVKILNRQHWHDPILVARFQREARAMAKVRHPNLIDVTHHGLTDEGMPFLVMEYLEGWDLLVELRRLGAPMPWERTVELALQMCAGLSAAHSAGIVHRDIKPSNCFLARSGDGVLRVKLLDLGIAKLLDADQDPDQELTKLAGGIPGTLHYMAPEQIRGEAVDPRTDLY